MQSNESRLRSYLSYLNACSHDMKCPVTPVSSVQAEEAYKAGLEVEATHQGCSQGLADVKAGASKSHV